MAEIHFKRIGLMGRQRQEDISDTLLALCRLLQSKGLEIILESETAAFLPPHNYSIQSRDNLAKACDLIIVVGGDGSLLNAAHSAILGNTPVLGINRGRLGFLTDIHPQELATKVSAVLDGHYIEEKRFLLSAQIEKNNQILSEENALNDVVLMLGDVAHMIEFAIYFNEEYVCNQRADGLIVATPTGSTAYALSGGGPILHPQLEAVALVPMFPHTLSARPIVIDSNNRIRIHIADFNESMPRLSCDGQKRVEVPLGANIIIQKKKELLRLIHPTDYNYFETLRRKLQWSTKL